MCPATKHEKTCSLLSVDDIPSTICRLTGRTYTRLRLAINVDLVGVSAAGATVLSINGARFDKAIRAARRLPFGLLATVQSQRLSARGLPLGILVEAATDGTANHTAQHRTGNNGRRISTIFTDFASDNAAGNGP